MYIAVYRSFQQNMHELEPLITDFEMLCSCRLTMHDHHHLLFNGSGELMVKNERFSHRKSYDACGYAARSYCVSRCMFQYNNHVLRTRCRSCIKRCMCGNIEVAAPIFNGSTDIQRQHPYIFSVRRFVETPRNSCRPRKNNAPAQSSARFC